MRNTLSAACAVVSLAAVSSLADCFDVPEGQAICHQMGRPQEQRLVWLHNEQAITSPEWSVHSAAGTSNYMFIWGMGGENLNYGDMDKVSVMEMR